MNIGTGSLTVTLGRPRASGRSVSSENVLNDSITLLSVNLIFVRVSQTNFGFLLVEVCFIGFRLGTQNPKAWEEDDLIVTGSLGVIGCLFSVRGLQVTVPRPVVL